MMKVLLLNLGCLLLSISAWAQIDFNRYTPLKSQGEVPTDFSTPTRTKITESELPYQLKVSRKKQIRFIEEINYSIDALLQSGRVTFGDPVSNYIQEIGDRLTKSESSLRNQLRFYAYNSNEANAFSTEQGIVFVTTGLIAQMTNEAQLAFVLAHEIIHYSENHVLDFYDYTQSQSSLQYDEKVRFFSKYSRDNEFEADKKGVQLYYAAGYPASEIEKTFDVLIYSYLPFEEIPFDKTYFNNQWMYVPEEVFKSKKFDISAREKYDDKLTSHPNVAKRTEKLLEEIKNFPDWGDSLSFSTTSFNEIRTICRFEYILNDVYENNHVDVLYGIYLLEKSYPNSYFLSCCKAQVWLNLMKSDNDQYEFGKTYKRQSPLLKNYHEGQISILAQAINRLPKQAKIALGLRIIRDNYTKDTADIFSKQLWNKAIELAASNDDFNFKQFSKHTFVEAIQIIAEAKKDAEDEVKKPTTESDSWDKYETIQNEKLGMTIDQGIDSMKYYLYGISDLVNDTNFVKQLNTVEVKLKGIETEKDRIFGLTDEEQSLFYSEKNETKLQIDLDSVLMINPAVFEFNTNGSVNHLKSDELEKRLLATIINVSNQSNLPIVQLDRSQLTSMTTEQYNDLAQLKRSLEKSTAENGTDVFLLDSDLLTSLKSKYGCNKLLFFDLKHKFETNIHLGNGILYTLLFPIGLIYFPVTLLTGHLSELQVVVFDLNSGEVITNESYLAKEPASRKFLELRLSALFHQLKLKKDVSE